MFRYLRALAWPKDVTGFIDLLSKTVVAATIAIVGVVYSHYQELEERRSAAAEAARGQLSDQRDAIGLFLTAMPQDTQDTRAGQKLKFLSAYCDAAKAPVPGQATSTSGVTKALCDEVSNFGQSFAGQKQAAATAQAVTAIQSQDTSAYLASSAAADLNAAVAASEAGAPVDSSNWYAVIASVPLTRPELVAPLARSLDAQLRAAGQAPGQVKVYETAVSRQFALTLGALTTQKEAKQRVSFLRRAKISPDAYVSPDRQWKPSTILQ